MKVLVFGPSGSGKTYTAQALRGSGVNAFEDGDIKGLSGWYDMQGNKVETPKTANEALDNHYSFVWNRKVLKAFLSRFKDIYIFGGAGNIFSMLDLFDKVFFLKVEPEIQRERILSLSRATPLMDMNENGMVIWGEWLEQEAKKHSIPFIDGSLTPKQIFDLIR